MSADAGAKSQHDHVTVSPTSSKPVLGPTGGICIVLNYNRYFKF